MQKTPTIAKTPTIQLTPDDSYNRSLVEAVHPSSWENPTPKGRYNLVVVGAGTAGLVAAAGTAGLGGKVALVERHLMGGDCLNFGCVPSKALLSVAHAAHVARSSANLGVTTEAVRVDFNDVMTRMRRLRSEIAPLDSAARFRDLGVDVYFGDARFSGPDRLEVAGKQLTFGRAVVATGARAAVPPIDGLAEAGYLTNETVFQLTELPGRFTIIGAGPIGCEMAQAFARMGSEVTLIDLAESILGNDDPDAADVVRAALERDGVDLRLGVSISEIRVDKTVVLQPPNGAPISVASDKILLAAGRVANVDRLGLDAAGVRFTRKGVEVDDFLRTSNKRIFASGDVASRFQFTHAADAMSRLVIRNALFWGRGRMSALTIPWVTFTDPELAHVGLTPRQAADRGIAVDVFEHAMADVDRALLEGQTEGFLRVQVKRGSDQIIGATLVSAHAGETIAHLGLAMQAKLGLGKLANTIHPYPTQADAIKRVADKWSKTRLTPLVARLFEKILAWRR